ncbi:EAL domain-containing protein [Thermithiobacillus plumbiphilus]|uniref:EAL domain-containing protein n=1 Tax=Thermithiobacillus plumbiphilus TaxID=1729899 RepID=A0ABU9D888_9PROT
MIEDPIDCAMVTAIHQLAQVLGIQTIAEFVKDDAILLKLRALKVDYAQGPAIHGPRPIELEFPGLRASQLLSA